MGRTERASLLREIGQERDSHVITYICGDRHPIQAQIAEDVVRPLYDHLLDLKQIVERRERVDLFLYSRGGDASVPWRLISMLRECCKDLGIIVPFRAQSAATMIALGADEIVMGPKAELGPIDPSLVRHTTGPTGPEVVSVEDVSSYIDFIQRRVGIKSQEVLGEMIKLLAERLDPRTLGSVNREHSHIRLVAEKLLRSHKRNWKPDHMKSIIKTLTEGLYSHGHAIGRKEAKETGLPVIVPDHGLEQKIWDLYVEYESLLQLRQPVDPWQVFANTSGDIILQPKQVIAAVESEKRTHAFRGTLRFARKRQMPPALQIGVNLTLGLPPNINIATLSPQNQQLLQQFLQQLQQAAQGQIAQVVQQQVAQQAPVLGIEVGLIGGSWQDVTAEGI